MLKNAGNEMTDRFRKYTKMTHEELLREALQLNIDNRRLKNRINDHEPFKQKVFRTPNQ